MSRLTDLIHQATQKDPQLGADLAAEFKSLSSRRPFGLNFERHRPEAVELPARPVRKGDKVRVLPPRGSLEKGDQRLWRVASIERVENSRLAHLSLLGSDEPFEQSQLVDDVVVVAEFRDSIYPGLVSTGKVERSNSKPFHTVINGENFHVLEALTYTHKGKVDVIYIDPPYNTGAKDWKYNNDYVGDDDLYQHSKWLAFMERRLLLAKQLLNPMESVLIVTIDEKEYLRLGMLLEQLFPEAHVQMVSSVINPKGTARTTYFSRTDEFLYVVFFGSASVPSTTSGQEEQEVRWRYLRRTDIESRRGTTKGGKSQFYPIYVNINTGKIVEIGKPLPFGLDRKSVPEISGCVAVFPIRDSDGMEMNWGLTGASLKKALDAGYVRTSRNNSELQPFVFSYLTAPNIAKIKSGELVARGRREDDSWIVVLPEGASSRPTTTWRHTSHDAGAYGTSLLRALMPERKFPYPKSLYAVEDVLRLFTKSKPDAIVLDFFAGSGTSAHAVMRLNKQDGGLRQCISVTNNEVSEAEQAGLLSKKLRPGDPEWEKLGICEHITKPRIEAAITGRTPAGNPIMGSYKFADEFPMAEGFEENAEFFTLTYETPLSVGHNRAFARVAPLLWMRAGSLGHRIDTVPDSGWAVAEYYGILFDLDKATPFCTAVEGVESMKFAYIVTDDDRRFQSVARRLPSRVKPVRLYESYLSNFRISNGE